LYALGIILLSALIGKVLKLVLNTLFKRLFAYTDTTLDDRLLDVLRGKVTALSIIAGTFVAMKEAEKGIPSGSATAFQAAHYFYNLMFIILVFVLTRLVIKMVQTTFNWYLEEISKKTQATITPTIAPLTTKLVNIVLFLIAGMIVLDTFGINIGSLLVSLGVGSLAIALAAQETVANMIAGFVILIDQPFSIGNRIKLASGEEGIVSQIGLRSTRIVCLDNNMMIIPNSDLVKNRIINYTQPGTAIRSSIDVGVDYSTDITKAKAIIEKIIRQQPAISPDFPITILTFNFADSSINLRIYIETTDFAKRFQTESDIRDAILREFKAEGINIPFPQRVITVVHETEKKKANGSQAS